MMFKTHMAAGLLVAVVALNFVSPEKQLLFAFLLLIGAAFPDIDHPKSRMGQMFWPIAYLFEHRGFFHSFFAIVIFPVMFFLLSGSLVYSVGFLLGYASHIFTDLLTTQGVMPFHPLLKFKLRGFMHTGAYYEYALFFVLIAVSIFVLLVL